MVFGRQKIGEKEGGEVAEWSEAPRAMKNRYLLKLFIKYLGYEEELFNLSWTITIQYNNK